MAVLTAHGTLLVAVLLGAVIARTAWELLFSPLKAFPGPFLAKFTNVLRAFRAYEGNFDIHARAWHRKCGSAVRVGPNAISLSDPDMIKVVYAVRNPWLKSDMYMVNEVLTDDGQRMTDVFSARDEAVHGQHSKPIRGLWSMNKLLEQESYVDETITAFTNRLGEEFADRDGDKGVCPMDDWLAYFGWDAAANITFGRHFGFIAEGRDVQGMIDESTQGITYFASISQIPWLDNLLGKNPVVRIGPGGVLWSFRTASALFSGYKEKIAEGDAGETAKYSNLFIDKYYKLKDAHPDFIDDERVVQYVMLNLIAGGDPVAAALRSIVYCLARHPAACKKLVEELDGEQLALPAQWRAVNKLPYLDAVIYETARFSPSIGLMMEREVPAGGCQLPDGRYIPAGTKVGVNPCVVTRDEGVFGERVDEFRPERWLRRAGEEEDAFGGRQQRMQQTADFMFGWGRRVCLGKNLAKMEMYKLTATLYSVFDMQLRDPQREWTRRNRWFMYQTDMPMVVRRRRPRA